MLGVCWPPQGHFQHPSKMLFQPFGCVHRRAAVAADYGADGCDPGALVEDVPMSNAVQHARSHFPIDQIFTDSAGGGQLQSPH